MIIPRLGQRSEMMYMDLFIIACILKSEKINLPYIMIRRLIKVWSSTLMCSNMFTKLFKRGKIKLCHETKNIALRVIYDIYSKKTKGIMHMVKHNGK